MLKTIVHIIIDGKESVLCVGRLTKNVQLKRERN